MPGRFATLFELTRYIRALATLVTPDPNAMLRVARLRDAKWAYARRQKRSRRKAARYGAWRRHGDCVGLMGQRGDQECLISSFLTFDNRCAPEGATSDRLRVRTACSDRPGAAAAGDLVETMIEAEGRRRPRRSEVQASRAVGAGADGTAHGTRGRRLRGAGWLSPSFAGSAGAAVRRGDVMSSAWSFSARLHDAYRDMAELGFEGHAEWAEAMP